MIPGPPLAVPTWSWSTSRGATFGGEWGRAGCCPAIRSARWSCRWRRRLTCLHAHGIVHRDLKPENILMHHGSTPMVTDFGLAVLDTDGGGLRDPTA